MLEQYITSFVDGRVRLRHGALKKAPLAEHVQRMLAAIPGIRLVNINVRTGSLLAEYDAEVLDKEHLLALLRQWEHMAGWAENNDSSASSPPKTWGLRKGLCRKMTVRRAVNGGMLATLAASALMGATGQTRGHILAGGAFIALSMIHLWNVRKAL